LEYQYDSSIREIDERQCFAFIKLLSQKANQS